MNREHGQPHGGHGDRLDSLDRDLAALPLAELAPARASQALAAAQQALLQRPPTPAWLLWYERRVEPALLVAACVLFLAWSTAAATPPPSGGHVGQEKPSAQAKSAHPCRGWADCATPNAARS